MEQEQRSRRRIDRVTAPDYLDGLDERSPAEVRAMRDECRDEEAQLSYLRRILQGQLDIALVELSRRTQAGDRPSLVADLPSILSDRPSPAQRDARAVPLYDPEDTGRRTTDAERFSAQVGQVPELDDDQLAALVRDVREAERGVSDRRKLVLERLDTLQEELVRRYRDGAASVDDLVAPTLSAGPDERGA